MHTRVCRDWTKDVGNELNAHVYEREFFGDAKSVGQFEGVSWPLPGEWPLHLRKFFRSSRLVTFGGKPLSFATLSDVVAIMMNSRFSSFAMELENTIPHIAPHMLFDGQMGGCEAPADPLFFMHHGTHIHLACKHALLCGWCVYLGPTLLRISTA